jgi:hypothetical protein
MCDEVISKFRPSYPLPDSLSMAISSHSALFNVSNGRAIDQVLSRQPLSRPVQSMWDLWWTE